ncbi:MAG: lipid-A-disaccharide synthase [Deltaproteobacteria bacterium]|nr:lipid-A-disaccharide synthase [Deltaproteobacteria bacterium]
MDRTVLIIAGEESGERHGAELISELKAICPAIRIIGMGGHWMREAGQIGLDYKEVSVVGLVEVIGKLPAIFNAFRRLKAMLDRERPSAVVLIDFPDFNLRFAKEAKKRNIPVIYYISPQVWAWRKGRIKKIARLVTKMLVVFPFEVPIYRDAGVDVEFVGHPLKGRARSYLTKSEAMASFGIRDDQTVIALVPGSRKEEVGRLLGPMTSALGILKKGYPTQKDIKDECVFLLAAADSIEDGFFNEILKGSPVGVRLIRGDMYGVLRAADAAIVASGTATLETALIGTPMVIVYSLSRLSHLIGRFLIRVKYAGLPNIIAGREIVPELIQDHVTAENIARELYAILTDEKRRKAMLHGFGEIGQSLGRDGASHRAGEAVCRLI